MREAEPSVLKSESNGFLKLSHSRLERVLFCGGSPTLVNTELRQLDSAHPAVGAV